MTYIPRALKALFALLLAAACGAVSAQTYPDHTIRIITPYAPGGGTDILLRILAPKLNEILGQTVLVDNRPGGATMLGTGQVARATPDGYTLLAADSTIVINPGLFKDKLPYDTLKNLTGVTMMATAPVILLVNPEVPAKTVPELLKLAKAEPGKLNFGSGGIGAGTHLAGELLKMRTGINIVHVPYNGTSPGLNAVISGQVQMMFGGISSARQFISAGRVRGIAVTGDQRNPALPDVPTFKEEGLDIDASTYWGIYAPAGVPPAILDKIARAFKLAMQDPENLKKMSDLGYIPIGNSPSEHTKQLQAMVKQWTEVVDKAQIKVD